MSHDIHDLVTPSCTLLGLGEPTHQEPAFGRVRNALLARLADRGFRSVALETDRVAALRVDAYVQGGPGSLDSVMAEGFSHGFGEQAPHRELVAWMRDHNAARPAAERLAFHGFDTPTENYSAPSPRAALEHVLDYLGLAPGLGDTLAGFLGEDERWSRQEAVLDAAQSPGATVGAARARALADDLVTALHSRAPELIAATSLAAWRRARTHLTAGIGLLRYHRQCAEPGDRNARITRLLATRDALMAENLLAIRDAEELRGPTVVFTHNLHLRRTPSTWSTGGTGATWTCAGGIVGALLGDRYVCVAGSVGRSEALGLTDPEPDTYEAFLQGRVDGRGPIVRADEVGGGRERTGTDPAKGYFPLDRATLDGFDAVLHLPDAGAVAAPARV
ncbi:erythromycin esterase family protein [Streptomyces sp. NPDC050600]|uniref:erythromycin esterase family protein n=1 Tax=Streptomyces sp. NPDC050600 TaxID=3157213 RepID=UPI003427F659